MVPMDFMVLEMEEPHLWTNIKPLFLVDHSCITKKIIEFHKKRLTTTILRETMMFKVLKPALAPSIYTVNKCAFISSINSPICDTNW